MELPEGYQQQLHHWRATLDSGAMRIGWKLGFTAPDVQQQLGLEHAVVGHLTTATLLGADGTHSLTGAETPLVEPEIAIQVGANGAVAGLAPAIEVIDMPDLPDADEVGEAVAGNIFHRAVAIGSSSELASAEGVRASLTVNGEDRGSADAGATDLREAMELVDSVLREAGESLQAGDRIIAGTLAPPVAVAAGDRAVVDLGPIGRLEVTFT